MYFKNPMVKNFWVVWLINQQSLSQTSRNGGERGVEFNRLCICLYVLFYGPKTPGGLTPPLNPPTSYDPDQLSFQDRHLNVT